MSDDLARTVDGFVFRVRFDRGRARVCEARGATLGHDATFFAREPLLAELVAAEDAARVEAACAAARDEGAPRGCELRLVDAAGRARRVRAVATPVGEGELLVAMVDVDGVEPREGVRSVVAKVFERSPIAISISTLDDGRFLDVNEAFAKMVGWPRREIVGRGSLEIPVWAIPAQRAWAVEQLRANGRLTDYDVKALTRSGALIDVVIDMELVDLDGRPGILAIFHDVTARRRAEAELKRLYERQRELDRLKANFVANVSHELRTPLTLILGLAERLARAPELADDARADVAVLDANARTLLAHVDDLLDVARLEAGKETLVYAEVDVAHLVREAARHFDRAAGERRVALAIEADAPVHAQLDAAKVRRIVVNLLSNALKFTPRGGRVRVGCAAREGSREVVVTVADSGHGVPSAARQLVFERFVRLDASANEAPGTGLGLAIVKDLAELHGGRVSVDDGEEGGARFVVALPLVAPEGAVVAPTAPPPLADARFASVPPASDDGASEDVLDDAPEAASRPLVLVVEDHGEMRRFVARTLAGTGAYRVATARDGEEGLARALELHPDLVLTDVMMPRMSGDRLVAAIRAREELRGVPILVLTAKADDRLRVELLRAGAQDYVMKPFAIEELLARVSNLVDHKRACDALVGVAAAQERDLASLADLVSERARALEAALQAANLARDAATRANELKTRVLRMISHELRTPVASIDLQLAVLERRAFADEATRLDILRRARRAAARLTDLIESLLAHARLESERLAIRPASIDVDALARAVVDELRPDIDRKAIVVAVRTEVGLPALVSDAQCVRIILANLVGNALKFVADGEIAIALSRRGGVHVVEVSDTGPGIPAELRDQVFLPFERLEPVDRKHTPGIGLGLAIVRELAEALGGGVRVEARAPRGSTFVVELPDVREA